jgi:hypothetical protein
MKRTTPILTVALAIAVLAWEFWPMSASHSEVEAKTPSYSWEEIHRILEESARLETYRKSSGTFHTTLIEIQAKLAAGETTLAESTAVIVETARRDHPEFLRHVRESEPEGRSDRECVGLNLIRHLEQGIESAEYPPDTSAHLEELRAEFASRPFRALGAPACAETITRGDWAEDETLP